MTLKLIKENVNYRNCSKEIKDKLIKSGFEINDEKDTGIHYQCKLSYNSENVGYLRFYQKKKGSTTIDDSQIKQQYKEKIRNSLEGYIKLDAFRSGVIQLGTRHISDPLVLKEIKDLFINKFPELIDKKQKNQVIDYRLEGNNLIVQQYAVGTLLFQGKSTAFSDNVIKEVDKIIQKDQRSKLLSRIKEQVPKEKYEEIERALLNRQITLTEFISPILYSFLSGCGSYLLQDGLTIFHIIKEKKIKLKDYGSILRNFSMLFEDFLTDWLIKLDLLKEEHLKINVKSMYIGKLINDPNILPLKYKDCYFRIRPRFVDKLRSTYQECRHDLLHADKFKYEPIKSLDKAYAKLTTMIECMEDCVKLFEKELNISDKSKNGKLFNYKNKRIIGTDESGKGDFFGPLVVAGVFVENQEIENKLRQLGVQDSKNITDKKAIELSKVINKLCKVNVVKITPERYNELYNEIKNLNTLLGWGHARVIENMTENIKPDYVISDKFGDESFINTKLMKQGKKVNLIQEIKAEENIAVAAASIVARANFLLDIGKLSSIYKINFPKGAGDQVITPSKEFISKHGKDNFKKIAKLHFKTTEKIL